MEHIQKIREKVIKANPKLKDTIASWEGAPGEWRCILSDEGKQSYFKRKSDAIKKRNRYGHVDGEKGDMVRVWWDGKVSPEWLHKDRVQPSVIDTQTIRLADVLVAIQKSPRWIENWFVTTGGDFYNIDEVGSGDAGYKYFGKRYWNLAQDDLTQQSPETLEFLSNLLE